jgi:hypothetical protein
MLNSKELSVGIQDFEKLRLRRGIKRFWRQRS